MPTPPCALAESKTSIVMPDPWQDAFYQAVGVNRKQGGQQIEASNDIDAINVWLTRVAQSPHTYRVYRKEIERLLLWARRVRNKCFSGLTLEDLQAYTQFIKDPQPADIWCNKRSKVPRGHSDWRPFSGALSAQSQAQAMRIIGICFGFLVDAGYLSGNPCRLIAINKIAPTSYTQTIERYLEQDLWQEFIEYIDNLPRDTDKQVRQHERLRFLFRLLYLQSPRVSEVAGAAMSSFYKQHGRWWWRVIGKGNKEAVIPTGEKMIEALKRYRTFLNLHPLPSPSDNSPLLRNISGKTSISVDMVYRIVKSSVMGAAAHIERHNQEGAEKLRIASTHWFRHTAISHQADQNIDIRFIRASARHSSIVTTQKYLHHDIFSWHDAMDNHGRKKQDT